MEDSGYFSHRSSEFKLSTSAARGGSEGVLSPDAIFDLNFDDLNSSKYSYLRYGFTDEEDFEDFKQDLKNFRKLKRETIQLNVDSLHESHTRGNNNRLDDCSDDSFEVSKRESFVSDVFLSKNGNSQCHSEVGATSLAPSNTHDSVSGTRTKRHSVSSGSHQRDRAQVENGVHLRRGDSLCGAGNNKRKGVYFDGDSFLQNTHPCDGLSSYIGRDTATQSVEPNAPSSVIDEIKKSVSFSETPYSYLLPPVETSDDSGKKDFFKANEFVTSNPFSLSHPTQSRLRLQSLRHKTDADTSAISSPECDGSFLDLQAKKDRCSSLKTPVVIPIQYVGSSRRKCNTGSLPNINSTVSGKYDTHFQVGEKEKTCYFDSSPRSGLLESIKQLSSHERSTRESNNLSEPLMEFFSGDEHFQEFERVFETIKNHRFSRDLDSPHSRSWLQDDNLEKDPLDDEILGVLHIDETFLDFFDHDEDFLEFERELEKIKSNRRSRLLENLNRRSSCDIFSDVKAFCDRSLKNSTGTSPKVERRRNSARSSTDPNLWNSAEEWEVVINKLKRNSRLLSDQSKQSRVDQAEPQVKTVQATSSDQSKRCPYSRDCQYTCHLNCVPSVTLDCTTVSPGSGEGLIATPTDLPSPSASAETSLIDRRRIVNQRLLEQQSPAVCRDSKHGEHLISLRPKLETVQHAALVNSSIQYSSQSKQPVLQSSRGLEGSGASITHTVSSHSPQPCNCGERDLNQNAKKDSTEDLVVVRSCVEEVFCDSTNEKDETDSGYRSGTIPDEKLPKAPSQATLNRQDLGRRIQTYNHFVPHAVLEQNEDGESFRGFLRVTLNLVRPITMELGARPPSIYELLTREHIIEQSTQHIAFYMPRDTVKSIHVTSKTTTKEVITGLLKKFHILDNPRKFAMYEQEFNDKNKLVKLRRLTDKDYPLVAILAWEPERIKYYRLVLQENETGEIVWDAFSFPELNNFMKVLDREEEEAIAQLQYKYRVMKRIILQRLKELKKEKQILPIESAA